MKWNYCENECSENHYHLYSDYENAIGQIVCYQCDPLGENWRHSPLAKAEVARVLEMDLKWFEENPVWFLDENGKPVGFKDVNPEVEYSCPYCNNWLDWYPVNGTLKWSCNC